RYLRFVRSFLLPAGHAGMDGDLIDRFTGSGLTYDFDSEAERRFLALSSVKYLISRSEYRSHGQPTSEFRKIYAGEALVYEVPDVLPRAALFSAVEVLPDDAVLARLKDPAFNPREKVVVSRETMGAGNGLSTLIGAPPSPPSAVRISRYQSQDVAVEAETPAPALLVLNDTNYPGWRAYVNGQPADMLTANFLFRGVLLPAGKSTVEFKYQPRSFRIGSGVSGAALAILLVLVWRERRTRA
ncbi:MAG TPA: YfhO family protein, partial [Rhizomicrobium sp.]|nr:YfhO family protein [Rhizomicrobium sp.]